MAVGTKEMRVIRAGKAFVCFGVTGLHLSLELNMMAELFICDGSINPPA